MDQLANTVRSSSVCSMGMPLKGMMSTSTSHAILTSLLLAVLVHSGECFSSGAPSSACTTLSPDLTLHGAPPAVSSVPYSIDLSAFDVGGGVLEYIPGNSYSSKSTCVLHDGVILLYTWGTACRK